MLNENTADQAVESVVEMDIIKEEKKRVNPMRIRDPKSGKAYVLDFSRESVKFAEDRKFKFGEVGDYIAGGIPSLFFYSFRKNHPTMTPADTEAILKDLGGGLTEEEVTRLLTLRNQAIETLIIAKDNVAEARKNSLRIVEL